MNKLYFVIFLIVPNILLSQEKLVIPVNQGPVSHLGALYSLDTNGANGEYLHIFKNSLIYNSNKPNKLVQHSNGKIYGITSETEENPGSLFEFNPTTNVHRKVSDFNFSPHMVNPNGQLMIASNGKIYGTVPKNGPFDEYPGSIFEYDPVSDSVGTFYKFRDHEPHTPYGSTKIDTNFAYVTYQNSTSIYKMNIHTGSVVLVHGFENNELILSGQLAFINGLFYGFCGYFDQTKLFSINPVTDEFKIEKKYSINTATFLYDLVPDTGSTWLVLGSVANNQALFRFDTLTKDLTPLLIFDGYSSVCRPANGLIYKVGNKVYGLGWARDSLQPYELVLPAIYSYDLTTYHLNVEEFLNVPNSGDPIGMVFFGDNIYMVNRTGGLYSQGNLFKYSITGDSVTIIEDFGMVHYGTTGIILNSAGKLVLTSKIGGSAGNGQLYEYDPITETFTELYDFSDTVAGINPSGFISELAPNKYLTKTSFGAFANAGGVSMIFGQTNTSALLYNHSSITSIDPVGELTELAGYLYGITSGATIYRVRLVDKKYEGLINLPTTSGLNPKSGLTLHSNGKFYGVCNAGGASGHGTIYEFDPASLTTALKKSFSSAVSGRLPLAKLIEAGDSKLYGLTRMGGSNDGGTLFSYDPATNTLIKLKNLGTGGISGTYPEGGLSLLSPTELIGTFSAGGTSNNGSIFKYDYSSGIFTELAHNTTATGIWPSNTPLLASDAKVYGLTYGLGYGTKTCIYKFDPSLNVLSSVYKYQNLENGSKPEHVYNFNGKFYSVIKTDNLISETSLWEYNPLTNTGQKIVLWLGDLTGKNIKHITFATNGFWYVTTALGGTNNYGTIVKVNPSGFSATKVLDYNNTLLAVNGKLIEFNGGLYDFAYSNNTYIHGCIYKFNPNTNTTSIVFDFAGVSGIYQPIDFVISQGTAFCLTEPAYMSQPAYLQKINLANGTLINNMILPVNSGYEFSRDFTLANNGSLYFSTTNGGTSTHGAYVKVDTATLSTSIIYDIPYASPYSLNSAFKVLDNDHLIGVVNSNSTLIPTTLRIFKLNTVSNQFSIITDFSFSLNEGANCYGNIITCSDTSTIHISGSDTLVCIGQNFTLNAVSNSGTYQKQWYFNSNPIPGETGDSYTHPTATLADTGNYYCALFTPCGITKSNAFHIFVNDCDSVYPGDCNRNGTVLADDFLSFAVAYNANGSQRIVQDNYWIGHSANNWMTTFQNQINYKHVDCNGDGLVNLNDTTAIILNLNSTHIVPPMLSIQYNNREFTAFPYIRAEPSALYFTPGQAGYIDFYLENDTIAPIPLYGISFGTSWNAATVQSGSATFNFLNNCFYPVASGLNFAKIYGDEAEMVETRLNHLDTLASGFLGRFNFLTASSGSSSTNMDFSFANVKLINHMGQEIPLGTMELPSLLLDFPVSIEKSENQNLTIENHCQNGYLTLRFINNTEIYSGNLFNSLGMLCRNIPSFSASYNFSIRDLKPGIYFLELISEKNKLVKKLVIQ